MNHPASACPFSRRGFLAAATALLAAARSRGASGPAPASAVLASESSAATEPFWGPRQGGILTPPQEHTYFAAFDLTAGKRSEVIALLRAWTAAAARLTEGRSAQPEEAGLQPAVVPPSVSGKGVDSDDYAKPAMENQEADTGEARGLRPARLTLTFGFGPTLFEKDGRDRYGLAARRPAALADLPNFAGDQLVKERTGGDLSVQACSDDAQVAFHAVRQLVRIAEGVAQIRWAQTGFLPRTPAGHTARNLMGFKDGTGNVSTSDDAAMARAIWAGSEGPAWMRGGSYMVVRRIRIALEHWDRTALSFQEQTVGRHKVSGAPLGKKGEFEALELDRTDADGNAIIPETSHVALAAAESNGGTQMLRRPYSYNDGVNVTAERWPPWRQGLEYDAGLFFLSYQRDPRTAFVRLFERMSKLDMMNQFTTHVGSALFAVPAGVSPGEFIGQGLFGPDMA